MALPAFVNQNNATAGPGTSVTCNNPSLTIGNILISSVAINASNQTATISGGGSTWNLGGTSSNATLGNSAAWAWTIVTASTTGVTFNWSTSTKSGNATVQYSGQSGTPIGATTSNMNTVANGVATANSVTTTGNNSLIIHSICGGFDNGSNVNVVQTPVADYTQRLVTLPFGGMKNAVYDSPHYASGTASDSQQYLYVNFTNQLWNAFTIELTAGGSVPANEPATRASQTTEQVLESYSNITNLLASQTTMQVLRTQSVFIGFPHSFGYIVN